MTDSWWPEEFGNELPAFRVKRQTYGLTEGGDYVRGSAWIQGKISGTLPTDPVIDDTWELGSPLPPGIPDWQPPQEGEDEDGEPIWPPPVPAKVGHLVRWDGDSWVNIGPLQDLPHTAVRYPSTAKEDYDAVGKALLYCRPFDYHTVEILWSWPHTIADTWLEVTLVRSSFGIPATPRDGMTVFRALRGAFDLGENNVAPPPIVYDQPLPSGQWYYYSLFFRMNAIDWIATMGDACVLPNDWGHRNHLWNAVPPYYQWVDDNYRVGAGFLRQFLNVFGFSLDNTRQLVESLLDLYRVDYTPMPLLKGLGANFNIPYEAGLGDIRYRGLVAYAPAQQYVRGTQRGLIGMIEAASKYQCNIESSSSLMLYPDDSEFYRSTGNWGGVHPDALPLITSIDGAFTSVAWDDVVVARVDKPSPEGLGRGVMRVYTRKSVATQNLIITVGDSRIRLDNPKNMVPPAQDTFPPVAEPGYRDAIPVSAGISIQPGRPYGFTINIQGEAGCGVTPFLLWVGPTGAVTEIIAMSVGLPDAVTTTMKEFRVQGYASLDPKPARYLIPGLLFTGRVAGTTTNRSPWLDFAGAMVYRLSTDDAPKMVPPPDRFLTIGDAAELIGDPADPEAPGGFLGFWIGSPKTPRT